MMALEGDEARLLFWKKMGCGSRKEGDRPSQPRFYALS